jgi:hypothetical protein
VEDKKGGFRIEFWYAGQRCQMSRRRLGDALCGYVRPTPSNLFETTRANRVQCIDVYGGMTALFGFDTAHAGDYSFYEDRMAAMVGGLRFHPESSSFPSQLPFPSASSSSSDGDDAPTLKLKPWVRMETEFFAVQIASQDSRCGLR